MPLVKGRLVLTYLAWKLSSLLSVKIGALSKLGNKGSSGDFCDSSLVSGSVTRTW